MVALVSLSFFFLILVSFFSPPSPFLYIRLTRKSGVSHHHEITFHVGGGAPLRPLCVSLVLFRLLSSRASSKGFVARSVME